MGAMQNAVYSQLVGGLGNQMFQYAAALSLAERLGVPVRLDTRWFGLTPNRSFMLDRFKVGAEVADAAELAAFDSPGRDRLKRKLRRQPVLAALSRHALLAAPRVHEEASYHFDAALSERGAPVLLRGDFQSPRYFAAVAERVRAAFQLANPLSDTSRRIDDAIGAEAWPVSLHVRRGDYVANAHTLATHGVCPMRYYERAARLTDATSQGAAHYFIFSDDPEWVAAEFGWLGKRTVLSAQRLAPQLASAQAG